ncbi:MAG TPA: hypothetical protein DIC49_03525 [Gammaproteobacteria bacterium]|nr:hypothetical protein [Gammaproteobacteria bacterium]
MSVIVVIVHKLESVVGWAYGAERVEGLLIFGHWCGDRAGTGKQSVNDNQIRIRLVGWQLTN